MFSNIVNEIPIVGHVKGLLHYAAGDVEGGDKAVRAATRTSAVMAGGAAGVVGGPAGVVAGAAGAGLLMDLVLSLASGRPEGVLEGVSDIATDIGNGEVPLKSVIKTGIYVGADALSGFGGVALVSDVGGAVSKSVAKDVFVTATTNVSAVRLAATGSVTREIAKNISCSYPHSNYSGYTPKSSRSSSQNQSSNTKPSQSKPSNDGSSGSGSQPPKEPNKKNGHEKKVESHLDAFLKLFNASSLDDIVIRRVRLFENLEPGQVKSLKKLIKQLRLNGVLKRVVETVVYLFNKLEVSDVTFQNFLSLSQFVAAYISEQAAQKTEAQRGEGNAQGSYEQRREENLNAASKDAVQGRSNLLTLFMSLYKEISSYCCEPNFRNIFSAIYHYFKHKLVPQTGRQLTVPNYFFIIRCLLEKVKMLKEYTQLLDNTHPRRELVYDRVLMVFGPLVRIRIVIKIQDGSLELSSCYVVDDDAEYDKDGQEFIDPDKKRS